MSMIESFQERKALEEKDPEGLNFAVVGNVYSDGLSLIFPPKTTASTKHYKCNSAIRFSSGQRVKIFWDSGTYVVEYPVGRPVSRVVADVLRSKDNSNDLIQFTCNKTKRVFAVICTGISTWQDFLKY